MIFILLIHFYYLKSNYIVFQNPAVLKEKIIFATAAAKSLQSCPTLCNPIDGSPPGSPVPGILQARTLEWAAISFSNAWKWKVKVKSLSRVWLSATPWTAAYQAPPSMGFSSQECWSGVPLINKNVWAPSAGAVVAYQSKFWFYLETNFHMVNTLNSFAREKAMAPYSSTLAWKIPWMQEPVGCSPWGH